MWLEVRGVFLTFSLPGIPRGEGDKKHCICKLSRFGFEGPALKQISAVFVDGLFFKHRY